MHCSNILILPNHGNEPYLLGIKVALRTGAKKICVPLFYGDKQIQIIHEEFSDDLDKIYLSPQLGNILSPLLRSSDFNWNYANQVNYLYTKIGQIEPRIIQIENNLKKALNKGLFVSSITKSNDYFFSSLNIDCALNIGLPIKSFTKPTFFIFTSLMSEIYSTPINNNADISSFTPLANYWRNLEKEFMDIFIPEIHALSHLGIHFPNSIKCPPFTKLDYLNKDKIEKESILIIPSGTGVYDKELLEISKKFIPTYQVLSYSRKSKKIDAINPNIISARNIKAVVSRGGWGTIWKCLIYEKPLGYLNTNYSQDPEIAHTICTLNSLNIGFLIKDIVRFSPPSKNQLNIYKNNINYLMEQSKGKFMINGEDYWLNGIDFVSKKIASNSSN